MPQAVYGMQRGDQFGYDWPYFPTQDHPVMPNEGHDSSSGMD